MAVEYIVANKKEQNIGIIGLSIAVFESIAKYSIDDLDDVMAMLNTNFRKNISCKVEKNHLVLNINILVKIGRNVNEISQEVQQHVINEIRQMTNIKEITVNINIKGFYI